MHMHTSQNAFKWEKKNKFPEVTFSYCVHTLIMSSVMLLT